MEFSHYRKDDSMNKTLLDSYKNFLIEFLICSIGNPSESTNFAKKI